MPIHTDDTQQGPPGATPMPGPYLCSTGEQLPNGWQQTTPAPESNACLAFDPRRHTVVHSFEGQPDDHLAEITARAGFERFEVPGSPAGFFARTRSATQHPGPTPTPREMGMSR